MSDKLQLEILKELRDEQRLITKALPNLATKEEHNTLKGEFNQFMARVKTVGWLAAIGGSAIKLWAYMV